jgi:hypothetical protein
MSFVALLVLACAIVVIARSICIINRLHWTTLGTGYPHFLGFGLSYVALAAGALVAAIDALHGALSLASYLVIVASAGMILFDKRGPRR